MSILPFLTILPLYLYGISTLLDPDMLTDFPTFIPVPALIIEFDTPKLFDIDIDADSVLLIVNIPPGLPCTL